ncbi:MAG TPA: AAA family ATPase [Solirubrobacteraceae bacterium]|nr:AAA family ATPase [Solirubrobacteraceae bacterium]
MLLPLASAWVDIENWAYNAAPVFEVIFIVVMVVIFTLLLRQMPRIKPQEIKPDSASSVGWDDIAGVEHARGELEEVVEFLRDPKRFAKLGARVPRGVLLHGPPGTGKTLLAKAVAHESGARFYAQSASGFVEMFAGLGAARVRRLFRIARKNQPAIIFIDELDAIGGARGNSTNGEKDQTLNQLLIEMDGFANHDSLVVIAASNLLEKLDMALLRPGRFDRQIYVSPPDVNGREQILRVHVRNKPVADVDLAMVARQTSGLTGADLANICNEAAIFAARRGGEALANRDFDQALERVIAGTQSRRVLTEHEKRVVAYHEAGHALIAELLPAVDRVHRVSIVPRGRALGYTLNLPDEDRYLKTREELLDQLTMLLGGRAAEQIVFGAVSTGAADDLRRASEIAGSMITDFAMGTTVAVTGRGSVLDDRVSEQTLRLRDEEREDLLHLARSQAHRLLTLNRPTLEALAAELLEEEVLERSSIDRIVSEAAPARPRIAAASRGSDDEDA